MREFEVKVRVDLSQAWAGLLEVYRSYLRAGQLTPRERAKLRVEVKRVERKLRRSRALAS